MFDNLLHLVELLLELVFLVRVAAALFLGRPDACLEDAEEGLAVDRLHHLPHLAGLLVLLLLWDRSLLS